MLIIDDFRLRLWLLLWLSLHSNMIMIIKIIMFIMIIVNMFRYNIMFYPFFDSLFKILMY